MTLEAIHLVIGERNRQLNYHQYTPDTDDVYVNGELAQAAVAYHIANDDACGDTAVKYWPNNWESDYFKPSEDEIRNATKAVALGLAELERLLRKKHKENPEH